MEPEIIDLARRMYEAYADAACKVCFFDDLSALTRRGWLAAALVARPDLADVRVPVGHWAAGVLRTEADQ